MRFLSNIVASALGALLALGALFLLGFLFLLALAASSDSAPSVASDSVLEVRLEGPVPEIASDDPLEELLGGSGARYDLRGFRQSLRMAAEDDRIRAVRLQAEGTGAGWAQLQEMRTALERFKESGKPLYATTGETGMTEKDYLLASTADSVFAAPESLFEFNGFVLQTQFLNGTFEKLGVKPTAVRAGKFKSAVEQFTRKSLSEQNRRQLAAIVETINGEYQTAIARSRSLSVDSLDALADNGTVFSAEDAVRTGLADGLMYESEIDSLLTRRLRLSSSEEPNTISMKQYARTAPSDAGLELGGDAGEIAVVYGSGQIVNEEPGSFGNDPSQFLAPGPFRDAMKKAREDDDVKAVVVRVNSPGGQVAPSETMRHAVEVTARQKPVLVSMGNLAASGGYWMSVPADEIIADPLTLTGSIGVFAVLFNAQELFNDRLGITFDEVSTSPYANFSNFAAEPFSERERAVWQRFISDTYEAFLQHVAAGRGLTVAEVDSIGQGRVWTGQAAEERGLVDELGGLDLAVERAAERAGLDAGTYDVRALPRPQSFFERYVESLNTRAAVLWSGWRLTDAEHALLQSARRAEHLRHVGNQPMALWPFRPRIE